MSFAFYPTVSQGEWGKHCTIPQFLLPASSWAAYSLRRQRYKGLSDDMVIGDIAVPRIPSTAKVVAADCGGFVATKKWGKYRYTPEQYVRWLQAIDPTWAATMDFCCENEITTGNTGIVRQRQNDTTRLATWLWTKHKNATWVWVPTVQGWTLEEYVWHAKALSPLIREMQQFYSQQGRADVFRVGIGTLCARASADFIVSVVQVLADTLPGVQFHLWGVKLQTFKVLKSLSSVIASTDSAAWNGMIKSGRNLWKDTPYSQTEWCFKVALPAYEEKIRKALA